MGFCSSLRGFVGEWARAGLTRLCSKRRGNHRRLWYGLCARVAGLRDRARLALPFRPPTPPFLFGAPSRSASDQGRQNVSRTLLVISSSRKYRAARFHRFCVALFLQTENSTSAWFYR